MAELTIRSEDDAIALLDQLNKGLTFDEPPNLVFEGWPVFTIRITGKDFDGTVPTRIMPTLLELQKQVHRLYCQTRYDSDNIRKLTKEDRDKLELVVHHEISMSTIEKDKYDILAQSLEIAHKQGIQALLQMQTGHAELKNELATRLKPEDTLQVTQSSDDETAEVIAITGSHAKKVTAKVKAVSKEEMIEGSYSIVNVGLEDIDNLHLELRDTQDNLLKVVVPEGVLSPVAIDTLKNDVFERRPIHMGLLVRVLRGRITWARLISIKDEALLGDADI